jgi:hypothetical protein
VCGSQSELSSRLICLLLVLLLLVVLLLLPLWRRRQPEVLPLQHLLCYQPHLQLRAPYPPAAGTAAAALQVHLACCLFPDGGGDAPAAVQVALAAPAPAADAAALLLLLLLLPPSVPLAVSQQQPTCS